MMLCMVNFGIFVTYFCFVEAENSKQFQAGTFGNWFVQQFGTPTSRVGPILRHFSNTPDCWLFPILISQVFFCNHCQYITIRWSYPISYSHCIPSVVHYSHCVLKNPDSFPWRIYSNNYTYSYASFSQIKYP